MRKWIVGGLLIGGLGFGACGCRTLYRPEVEVVRPERVVGTNLVVVTNEVARWVYVTNTVGQVATVTNYVPVVRTQVVYQVEAAVTRTNWVVAPEVQTGVAVAQALPVPYAPLAGLVVSQLLTLGAWWMNGRKRKVAEAAVKAVVAGVEHWRTTNTDEGADGKLIEHLAVQQKGAGVEGYVKAIADGLTK